MSKLRMSKFDQRAIRDLAAMGYVAGKCESYNPFSRRSHDLFGIFDFIAVSSDEIVGVQVTSRSNMAARRRKIYGSEIYPLWLSAGAKIVLMGYDKVKNRYRLKSEWVIA